MRYCYNLLWLLLSPLLLLRLLWRGRKQKEYLDNIAERFVLSLGHQPKNKDNSRLIWIHAVSLGETRAALPLCQALAARYPDHQLLLTAMTPTGRQAAGEIIQQLAIPGQIVYCPYDEYFAVRRFLNIYQPKIALILETEVWPNMIFACKQRNIPILLVNARLSAKSLLAYQRFLWLWLNLLRPAWASFDHVAAQSNEDAERITQVGATSISVVGNLKFDFAPPAPLIAQGRQWRKLWLDSATSASSNIKQSEQLIIMLASSRDGEELFFLKLIELLNKHSSLGKHRYLIVPRHPQRFDQVIELVANKSFRYICRSQGITANDRQILIGDSLGELPAYYSMADIALIGGSFGDFGGQNLIEACACGVPVILGPSQYNFQAACKAAIADGAALQLENHCEKFYADGRQGYPSEQQLIDQAYKIISTLLSSPEEIKQMRTNALVFAAKYRGATRQTMQIISNYISP